jgi:hypothetical protein
MDSKWSAFFENVKVRLEGVVEAAVGDESADAEAKARELLAYWGGWMDAMLPASTATNSDAQK